MKYDFSGYATRNNLKCSDGRVIRNNAFKDNDGTRVPLVWQHIHNDANNVLGHAILENRDDGVYAYCSLNDTEAGRNAKELVKHGDISQLSIYANKLVQNGSDVVHGVIREVSLVLSGANPGAFIDNLAFQHGDSMEVSSEEAIIYSGLEISHSDSEEENQMPTLEDVFESMTDEQKELVALVAEDAVNEALSELEDDYDDDNEYDDDEEDFEHSDRNGAFLMHKNVFENETPNDVTEYLSHSDIESIFEAAKSTGSLKEAALAHADQTYGIGNIDILFPDAKFITETPEFIKRRTEWVNTLMSATSHSPFSRIKSATADITADEARARGYLKGRLKKEEFFKVAKRVTTPTTIYKKQKLDRDDIIDITDFDVVAWVKAEMRVMFDEEIARAVLLGDGRDVTSEDKIDEEHIRPIWKDDPLYTIRVNTTGEGTVPPTPEAFIDHVIRSREDFEGSGTPYLFLTQPLLTDMLLLKDKMGRYMYDTKASLAAKLNVRDIVTVPIMKGVSRTGTEGAESGKKFNLQAILVNPQDYVIGADKGGAIGMFDDFDIDYNQYKYLMETRISGALKKAKSAVVFEYEVASN